MSSLVKAFDRSIVALLMGVLVLHMSGCDALNGADEEELIQQQFSYEVFDKNGELLKVVTYEHIGDTETEKSMALFGEHFLPSWIVEASGRDREDLKSHEIWLFADTGANGDCQCETVRFGFPFMEQWETGQYRVHEITKETWLERLRFIWESRENHESSENFGREEIIPERTDDPSFSDKLTASVYYYEAAFITERSYGLSIEPEGYIYQSTGGQVELTDISGDHVEGRFTVDLLGLPMEEIFFADEFPDDPEVRTFRITGDFVAEYGEYHDFIDPEFTLGQ